MTLFGLFMIAVGVSMDAFAVSICKGLSVKDVQPKHMVTTGMYFGGFQALMPLIGYILGYSFQGLITSVDHWIAFVLLSLIGANMIKESREQSCERMDASFSFKAMLPLAIATSIDALAVGVTFAFLDVDILPAIAFIGVVTFLLSSVGIKTGNGIGGRCKSKAELLGGVVLVLMGLKILLEHTGIIG